MSSAGAKLAVPGSVGPKPKLRAVLVEDNPLDAELVLRELRKESFDVSALIVQDEAGFAQALRTPS
jgi:hypothetical protein